MGLTLQQIEKFKTDLLLIKADLERQIEALKASVNLEDTGAMFDESTESDEAEEMANYLSIKRPLEARLQSIHDALDRCDKGTYGICLSCKGAIEEETLKVVPESELCRACKQKTKN